MDCVFSHLPVMESGGKLCNYLRVRLGITNHIEECEKIATVALKEDSVN